VPFGGTGTALKGKPDARDARQADASRVIVNRQWRRLRSSWRKARVLDNRGNVGLGSTTGSIGFLPANKRPKSPASKRIQKVREMDKENHECWAAALRANRRRCGAGKTGCRKARPVMRRSGRWTGGQTASWESTVERGGARGRVDKVDLATRQATTKTATKQPTAGQLLATRTKGTIKACDCGQDEC
jgi:hypothetical protein